MGIETIEQLRSRKFFCCRLQKRCEAMAPCTLRGTDQAIEYYYRHAALGVLIAAGYGYRLPRRVEYWLDWWILLFKELVILSLYTFSESKRGRLYD